MATFNVSIPKELKRELEKHPERNWSETAREEIMKKTIFENYMKTGKISDEEWEFCEKIDWHPVDELPLKEEFIEKLKRIKKEKGSKFKSIDELRKIIEG